MLLATVGIGAQATQDARAEDEVETRVALERLRAVGICWCSEGEEPRSTVGCFWPKANTCYRQLTVHN